MPRTGPSHDRRFAEHPLCITTCAVLVALLSPGAAFAVNSSWNPTTLVNTESFQTIDNGDNTTNVQLRFGQNNQEKIEFNPSSSSFRISRTTQVSGNLTVTGTTIVNVGNTAATPDTGVALEVIGTASGALFTQNGPGTNYFRGNVSIGKTTSTQKLDVAGTISGALVTQNGAGTNYLMGNVSVGKTTGNAKLDVAGTLSGQSLTVSTLKSCTLIQTDANGVTSCGSGGTTYKAGQGLTLTSSTFSTNATLTGTLVRFSTVSGSSVFANAYLASSGTLSVNGAARIKNTLNVTSTMSGKFLYVTGTGAATAPLIMTRGGRVGIGTASPAAELSIKGANYGTAFGGAYNGIWLNGQTSTNDYNFLSAAGDQNLFINRPSGVNIGFRMANATQMLLDSTGNLGIGNGDSNASANLEVTATAPVVRINASAPDSTSTLSFWHESSEVAYLQSDANTAKFVFSPGHDLHIDYAATTVLFVGNDTYTGNVGIGTETPQATLEVHGSLLAQSLTVSTLAGCSVIQTDGSGVASCGSGGTTYTAGQGLTLTSTSFKVNATLTGTLVKFTTVSGSSVFANTYLASSGTLSVNGAARVKNTLNVTGTMSGRSVYVSGTGTSPLFNTKVDTGRIGMGTTRPGGFLHVIGFAAAPTTATIGTQSDGIYIMTGTGGGSRTAGATGNGGDGGPIMLVGGPGSGSTATSLNIGGYGGAITLKGGVGGNVSKTATTNSGGGGGGVTITGGLGGNATGASSNAAGIGGAVIITGGDSGRVGISGNAGGVQIAGGSGGVTGGDVTLYGGRGNTTNGNVLLGYSATTARSIGKVGIGLGTPGAVLSVSGATVISDRGNVVASRAAKATLDVIGTVSGTSLTVSGLKSCSLIQTDVNGVASCGAGGTTYTAGQGLTLTSTSFKVNATLTGTLIRFTTVSGSNVFANTYLASSGTLSVNGVARIKNNLNVTGTESSSLLTVNSTSTANNYITGNLGLGKTTTKSKLDVVGTVSGSALTVSSLRSCTTIQTDANGVTSCGSAGSTYTAGQGLTLTSTSFKVNATLTGTSLKFTTVSGATFTQNGAGTNYFLGNVGVGTTSPGSTRLSVQISSLTQTGIVITDISGQTAASLALVRSDGIPMVQLKRGASAFAGQVSLFDTSGNETKLTGNAALVIDTGQTATFRLLPFGSDIYFQNTAAGGKIYFTGNGGAATTGDIVFLTRGNVGIGNSAPGADLSVSGSTVIGNNIGSHVANAQLEVIGTISGSALTISGLRSCTVIQTDANGVTSCGSGGTGLSYATANAIFLNKAGGTMTGAVSIQNGTTHTATATPLLNVRGTMSGRGLYVSGTGATPLLYTTLATGFVTFDGGTMSVDTIQNRVGVNTAAPKARFEAVGTISGALVTQNGAGDSYFLGNLGVGKTATKAKFDVAGTISGALVTQNGAGANYILGNLGIGKATNGQKLDVAGTISGAGLQIGGVTTATAYANVAPSTTTKASLNFGSGAGVLGTSVQNGDVYYNGKLKNFVGKTPIGSGAFVGTIFVNAAAGSASTNASPTAIRLIMTGATLAANSLAPNKTLRVTAYGVYTTAASPGNLTFVVRMGTTTVCTTSASALSTSAVTNKGWYAECLITVRTTGSTGTVEAQGYINLNTTGVTGVLMDMENTAAVTVNTTNALPINLGAQWSTTAGTSSITVRMLTIEAMN